MKNLALITTLALGIATASVATEEDHELLSQTQPAYRQLTSHCPSSTQFKAVLRAHQADVEAGRDFDFINNDHTWKVSGILGSTYGWTFDSYLALPLAYKRANGMDVVAQFSVHNRNALTLYMSY